MSDGAHLGISASRALDTIIGGDGQPTEEERQTPQQVRERIESIPLFEGTSPWEGSDSETAYNLATDAIAHAFLVLLEEDSSLLEPVYYPDDCEHEVLRGKQMSPDSPFWEAMKERWPHADDWIGGASGFMVGFALNTALYASGKNFVAANPALMTIDIPDENVQ